MPKKVEESLSIIKPKALRRLYLEESNVLKDITCKLGKEKSECKNRFRVVTFKDVKMIKTIE